MNRRRENLLQIVRETGSEEALDALVRSFIAIIQSAARRLTDDMDLFRDLVQEGLLGVVDAVWNYDYTRGASFETYAYSRAVGRMRHYLRDRCELIRRPAWIQELQNKVERRRKDLRILLGRDPSMDEIADELDVSPEFLKPPPRLISLDALITAEDDPECSSWLPVDDGPFQERVELETDIDSCLSKLPAVSRMVVEKFFFDDMSKADIARNLGVSDTFIAKALSYGMKRLARVMVEQGVFP